MLPSDITMDLYYLFWGTSWDRLTGKKNQRYKILNTLLIEQH